MAKTYVALCQRCNGTGRYDRGACFGCRSQGSMGWVSRTRASKVVVQVTAIRDEAEGRIPWLQIYDATPKQAIAIVKRLMQVKGRPQALQDSVQATVLVKT